LTLYFDNAATSWPKPESVYQVMDAFARNAAGNPGRSSHAMAVAASSAIYDTRVRIAKFFGAESPTQIAFTLNATDALNIAIKGVLRPGDHVISTMLEHNSVIRPLAGLANKGVISLDRVSCGASGIIDPEEIRKLLKPKTRLIAITHCSNVLGTLQPIQEVAQIAKAHGALLLVDGAQSAGVIDINVAKIGIDLFAAPGHKGLLGPMGTGFLYVRPGLELAGFREGGTGTRSEEPLQPEEMPDHLEAGTLNGVGLAGLGAGLKFLQEQGPGAALAHERKLASRFSQGLREVQGITLHGDPNPARRVGIVCFSLAGMEPVDLGAILDQSFEIAARSGLHCAPDTHRMLGTLPQGTMRFSFGQFNTLEQVDEALVAIRSIAAG
jgi:cysteine desulfurase/selenocysteine lyase